MFSSFVNSLNLTLEKCLQIKEHNCEVDTVKPAYNSPVYKWSACILWSPENFLTFSVALYFPQN